MDAGKVGKLPDAVWDALLAVRASTQPGAVSAQAGAATPYDHAALPAGSKIAPYVSLTGLDIDKRVPTAAVLPAGGYTVNLSAAGVTASRAPAPTTQSAPAAVDEDLAAPANPPGAQSPVPRTVAERLALRTEQAVLAAMNVGLRQEVVARPAMPAEILSAAALNVFAQPELARRGAPLETAPRGTPGEAAPRGTPTETAPRGTPGEPAPRGRPAETAPRGISSEPAPRGMAAEPAPTAGSPLAVATAGAIVVPGVMTDALRVAPGPYPAAPDAPHTPAQLLTPVPQAPRPYLDRVELSTADGLLVASSVAARPQAQPDVTSAPVAAPALPEALARADTQAGHLATVAFATAAKLAAAAEEAKAASRLSQRPTPELVQPFLVPQLISLVPTPKLFGLVVGAVALGTVFYLLL